MNVDEQKAKLKKKITDLGQAQGMTAIPLFVVFTLNGINRTPVPPERKHIVLLFHVGLIFVCAVVAIILQLKKSALKAQLQALELPTPMSAPQNVKPQNSAPPRPPIPPAR